MMHAKMNRARACLLGGAAGDALGGPVEFMHEEEIVARFGPAGIRSYITGRQDGTAKITDDTQMTLFTAAALVAFAKDRGAGTSKGSLNEYVRLGYLDWLATQDSTAWKTGLTGLADVPELNARRAPGLTCLSALAAGGWGTVDNAINNSKGCGGVMRVAPFGLVFEPEEAARKAADAAAITHGHPLGFISAAAFAYLVGRCFQAPLGVTAKDPLWFSNVVEDCCDCMERMFPAYAEDVAVQNCLIRKAIDLAEVAMEDDEQVATLEGAYGGKRNMREDDLRRDVRYIHQLGEGWVGEEALAVAVYACVRSLGSFSRALAVAANHRGDSDSTAAICGNIMGALLGTDALGDEWVGNLELATLIGNLADDLVQAFES